MQALQTSEVTTFLNVDSFRMFFCPRFIAFGEDSSTLAHVLGLGLDLLFQYIGIKF